MRNVIIAVLISSLVSYQAGQFMGGSRQLNSSPWLEELTPDQTYSSIREETSPLPTIPDDSVHHIDHHKKRFGRQNSGPLPYKCGVVFFYHIPSTGGFSINEWFRQYNNPRRKYKDIIGDLNVTYYQEWKNDIQFREQGKPFHDHPDGVQEEFLQGMREHVQNLGPDEWRVGHAHYLSLFLNESENVLNEWRSTVEQQGCHMINMIMFRDPLGHAFSIFKKMHMKSPKGQTEEEMRKSWFAFLSTPTDTGRWSTQLDFFLYNNPYGRRNPYNVTKEEKVRRALELIERHFDVVTVSDHDGFVKQLLDMSGWPEIPMKHENSARFDMYFEKKEVESLQKMLRKNGDLDLVDALKVRYHGYLSYFNEY